MDARHPLSCLPSFCWGILVLLCILLSGQHPLLPSIAMAPRLARLSCAALLASAAVADLLKLDFFRGKRASPLARRANGTLNVALAENALQNNYIIKLSIGSPPQVSALPLLRRPY